MHMALRASDRPSLSGGQPSEQRQRIGGQALVDVAAVLGNGREQVQGQNVLILRAEEVRRVLGLADRGSKLVVVIMPAHLPTQAMLHHPQKGLQGVCDPQLAGLPRTEQVQVDWQLLQGRHLGEQGDPDDVVWESHTSRNQQVLPRRPQGSEGEELAAALGPDQRLSTVRTRDLRLEGAEHLQHTVDGLLEVRLLARGQETEQVLGRLGELVLGICLFLVSPVRASPPEGAEQRLHGAHAVVVACHGKGVGLHAAKDALRQLAPSRARSGRRCTRVLRDADTVDARCIFLHTSRERTPDARGVDAMPQGLVRPEVRCAAVRDRQHLLLPPLPEAVCRDLRLHLEVLRLALLQQDVQTGIGRVVAEDELMRLQGSFHGGCGVTRRRIELDERRRGAELAVVGHRSPCSTCGCSGV
mmetsp:Transcript_96961/g.278577  ORF Transcript_96961/g.278577 Transcript_96961/m.278577 type:complete len:414 (+) Transcript_96961:376-1617(+)